MLFPWNIGTVFEIISIGDAEMLAQAFNGLAAITSSTGFGSMTRVGFMVGILAFGFRAFMTGRFELTPLLAGLIVYIAMFGPRATVIVIDSYTGAARPVANVPIGLAAPFALVTTMGRYFAGTFESAFAVIGPGSDYLGSGYLDSLSVLLRMRDVELAYANSPDVNKTSDIQVSITNYLVSCVYYDLMLDNTASASQVTREGIRTAPDTWAALRTTFTNIHTTLYLPGGSPQGQPYNCKNAYEILSQNYINPGSPYFLNILSPWIKSVLQKPLGADVDAVSRLQGALNGIGLSAQSAQTFATNAFISTLLARADQNFALSRQDVASAITTSQALTQRNVQWAAEKTMFEKVSRPVTAFVEVFLVAATPLMAFAIAAFGLHGFGTLGKFMMLHFWVTLWAPTLAVANMYIFTRVNRYVDYITAQMSAPEFAVSPISVLGMDSITMQLQTEYATGSMLAAATPMLTLMLIYGSSQVASMLAHKMSSVQEVDPKVASPSVMTSAPFYKADSVVNGSPYQTLGRTGASSPSISLGNTSVATRSSFNQDAETSSVALNKATNDAWGTSTSGGTSINYSREKGFTTSDSARQGTTAALNIITGAMQQTQGTATEMSAIGDMVSRTGTVSGAVGFGLPAHLALALKAAGGKLEGSAKASFADQVQKTTGVSSAVAKSFTDNLSKQLNQSESRAQEFMSQISSSGRMSDTMSYTSGNKHDTSLQVGKALTQTAVSQQGYLETDMANKTFGDHITSTAGQLYSNAKRNKGGDPDRTAMSIDRAYDQAFGGNTSAGQAALSRWLSFSENTNSLAGLGAGETTSASKLAIMAGNSDARAIHLGAREGLFGGNLSQHEANFASADRNAGVKPRVAETVSPATNLSAEVDPAVATATEANAAAPSALEKSRVSSQKHAAFARSPLNATDTANNAKTSNIAGFVEQGSQKLRSFGDSQRHVPAMSAARSGVISQPHHKRVRNAAIVDKIEDYRSTIDTAIDIVSNGVKNYSNARESNPTKARNPEKDW